MKYLVNRETKEHVKIDGFLGWHDSSIYELVEADAEGWIKFDGTGDPVSEWQQVDIKRCGNVIQHRWLGLEVLWDADIITHYRPVPDKPTEKDSTISNKLYGHYRGEFKRAEDPQRDWGDLSEMAKPVKECLTADLITRLKSAHEAAQSIPDLLAELRGVLEPMGYDLVARDPFVESEQSIETTKDDMSDWRNWREGDCIVLRSGAQARGVLRHGCQYSLVATDPNGFWIKGGAYDGHYVDGLLHCDILRFHSRPEKA